MIRRTELGASDVPLDLLELLGGYFACRVPALMTLIQRWCSCPRQPYIGTSISSIFMCC